MTSSSRAPLLLMVAGLCGLALYTAMTRPGAPAAMTADAVRGAWVGVCLGLEVLTVVLLRRGNQRPAA